MIKITNSSEVSKNVRRGVRLLDREAPGWEGRVRADMLVMVSQKLCVLGQLYGDYITGLDMLNLLSEPFEDMDFDKIASHGFCLNPNQYLLQSYDDLSRAWRDFIKKRRARIAKAEPTP